MPSDGEILVVKAANEREFGAAFAAMSQAAAGGVLVQVVGSFLANADNWSCLLPATGCLQAT
jgi:hypothetical protein